MEREEEDRECKGKKGTAPERKMVVKARGVEKRDQQTYIVVEPEQKRSLGVEASPDCDEFKTARTPVSFVLMDPGDDSSRYRRVYKLIEGIPGFEELAR